MSTENLPLSGSFSSHSGGGSSPVKTISIVQQEERMEQIMKVDAQALLKTIRELEQRLSEHQRQDSVPPWAQSLQSRLEQLEKMRSSSPDVEKDQLGAKVNPSDGINLSTLTMEERIMAKIRSEFETKIGNSQLHFEGVISSYSLEMERLHKLLMIRPTTSELQQVILNVQQQEHRTQSHLQEMQNLLMANVRDRISEEMLGCLLELRNARAAGEESSRLIAKQVSDFTTQMDELREGAQNSIIALQTAQVESKLLMEQQKSEVEQSRRQLKEEILKVNTIALGIKNDLKSTSEALAEQTARSENAVSKLEEKLKVETKRLEKDVLDLMTKLTAVERAQVEVETGLEQVKFNFEREMEDLKEWKKTLDKKFQDAEKRQMNSEKQISELVAQDFGGQIKSAVEQSEKMASEIDALNVLCEQTLTQDIRSNSLKISLLQEQCNIAIPKTLSEHAMRMNDILEKLHGTGETIDVLKGRHDQADELIASLLPLKDKVAFLSDAKTAHDTELDNLKEGITSCMDGNSEFARRMEEFEESLESFDESINSRMNRIRDTLLDTLLDKQGEASAVIRNARENMEVMSMAAGEVGMSVMGGGSLSGAGGGGVGPGGGGFDGGPIGPGGKGRGSINGAAPGSRMTVVHREGEAVVGQQGPGGPGGAAGQLKRLSSYRRPNMQGQVIQGNTVTSPVGNVPTQQPSALPTNNAQMSTPQGQPPGSIPAGGLASMRRSSSIRMQHQTQNLLTQHRKVVAMATHSESSDPSTEFTPPTTASDVASQQLTSSAPRNSMIGDSRGQQPAVHIPQPMVVDSGNVPPSPDPHNFVPASVGNVDGHPEGEHPAIELSPPMRQSAEVMDDHVNTQQEYFPSSDGYHQGGDISPHTYDAPPQHAQQSHYQQTYPPQNMQAQFQQAQHYVHSTQDPGFSQPSFDSFVTSSIVPVSHSSRPEILTGEYNQLTTAHGGVDRANVEQEAQFLADLCLNFEDISLKRKKVSSLPLAFCQNIAETTRGMAELIATEADFEMVEQAIASVNGPLVVQDIVYDETFIVNTRQKKQDEYIELVLRFVNEQISNGGVIRSDARQLFIALVRKALEMFMSKHNQVLVAGNSRLGRVKIPTCMACDRPLIEKSRLDRAIASPPPGTRGILEQSAATLRSGWSAPGGSQVIADDDPASHESIHRAYPAVMLENSQFSSGTVGPGRGILGRGLLTASVDSHRPKTMSNGNRSSSGGSNNQKVLKSSTMRPNSSAVM